MPGSFLGADLPNGRLPGGAKVKPLPYGQPRSGTESRAGEAEHGERG